jgi:two-component system cell cycle response regulator DivK
MGASRDQRHARLKAAPDRGRSVKGGPILPKPLVLVVDDFPDGRELVSEYLAFPGFDVCVAGDGWAAVELARNLRPRAILMDIAMPGMDGLDATRQLKADSATQDAFVIAVTARAMRSDEERARAVGCDGFVRKPYELTLLADGLWRLLRQGRGRDPVWAFSDMAARERLRRVGDRRRTHVCYEYLRRSASFGPYSR